MQNNKIMNERPKEQFSSSFAEHLSRGSEHILRMDLLLSSSQQNADGSCELSKII